MKPSLLSRISTCISLLSCAVVLAQNLVVPTSPCDFGTGNASSNPAPFNVNAFNSTGNLTMPSGLYDFSSFTLNAGHTITITGNQPVVIRVTGTASIQGKILAIGTAGTSVSPSSTNTSAPLNAPGGIANNGGGQNGGIGADYNGLGGTNGTSFIPISGQEGGGSTAAPGCGTSNPVFGAGGGGSFGIQGGATVSGNCGGSTQASSTYGDAGFTTQYANTNLLGGSGGGGGSYNVNIGTVKGGGGGSGGGAFAIVATNLLIGNAALLSVKGGDGGSGRLSGGSGSHYGCGGGGGSGGSILLLYNTINTQPAVNTNPATTAQTGIDISGGLGGASLLGNPGGNGGAGRLFSNVCSAQPCSPPQTQASNLQFSNITTSSVALNWTNGSGAGRVVYINTQNSFSPPANGANPTPNTTYSGGQQCVFNGTGSGPVALSGLQPATTYYVAVYEFCNPDRNYNVQPATLNPNSFQTQSQGGGACTAPVQQTAQITPTNIGGLTADVSWTNGNGAGRVVFINTSNAFSPPVNGNLPAANPVYSSGQHCIYAGTGSGPVSISGLQPNTQYWIRAFEYCLPDLLYTQTTEVGNPVSFTTSSSIPSLMVSPDTLTGFQYQLGSGPSLAQNYTVSGTNLNGSGDILVTASSNYELSLNGVNFLPSLLLPYAAGTLTGQPVIVSIRLKAGLPAANYPAEIQMHSGGGTTVGLVCEGQVFSSTSLESEVDDFIRISPNPMHSSLNIYGLSSGSHAVEWLNVQGQIVQKETLNCDGNNCPALHRKGIGPGVYMLRILTAENEIILRRCVVMD